MQVTDAPSADVPSNTVSAQEAQCEQQQLQSCVNRLVEN